MQARQRSDPARIRLARLERLQELTAGLSAAIEPGEVARLIFDRGLALVEARAITLFWEGATGELELLHGLGLSEAFVQRHRILSSDSSLPIAEAFRTGEPVWLGTPEAIAARSPEAAEIAREEGDAAWAAIPLLAGRSRGALGLRFDEPRPFDEEERGFVVAVARQCAEALERAHLFEGQRRLAERLRQVYSTAAALSGAATPSHVADAAFRGLTALGACAASIHALDGPERLVLLARRGPALPGEDRPLPVDAPAPAPEVVRTGKALWLESPQEIDERFPLLAGERAARGEGAWAVVPLLAGGTSLGALSIAYPNPHRIEAEEKTFVRMLAIPCAQALERARLSEEALRLREDAARDSAALDAMFAAAPVGLALLDREMRFVRVNALLAGMNGIAAEAHLGQTPAELLPGPAAAQMAAAFRRALERGAHDLTRIGELGSAPGETRRWRESWFPVRVEGAIVGVGLLVAEEPIRRS